MLLLLAVLLFSQLRFVSPEFSYPRHRREAWRIGDIKTIKYDTKHKNYTIALWHEALGVKAAKKGPVIFSEPEVPGKHILSSLWVADEGVLVETENGPENEFKWQVQSYDFDLRSSSVFFLWLYEGSPADHGKNPATSMSSPYFNITDEPPPSETPSASQQPPTVASIVGSTAKQLQSAVVTTSTTTSSLMTPQPSTASVNLRPTPATASDTIQKTRVGDPAAESSEQIRNPSDGLAVGAQAGIAVGIAVVGVTCIVFGLLWLRHVKKQNKVIAELEDRVFSRAQDPPAYTHERRAANTRFPQFKGGYFVNRKPVELG
ncbi:hypothetical protein C8034_v009482 [Colletotrichum sidae]|uniref:Uncharacterized protein n=1 Tax=Colletotrichum sidae TaxID=1347389 RepID=A0A4R8TKH4_9PEZI|nr:hypothetical protein C8034_v009482 [Colletotrichum sidae]